VLDAEPVRQDNGLRARVTRIAPKELLARL
jgi:hypothetical protein